MPAPTALLWWLAAAGVAAGVSAACSFDPGVRVVSTVREAVSAPPPRLPPHLQPFFTRCGAVPVHRWFIDDSGDGSGTHYVYPRPDVDAMVASSRRSLALPGGLRHLGKYAWPVQALRDVGLAGKAVVVFGSMQPLFEAACVALGAASVTTVEYNRLTYDHPRLSTVTVDDVLREPQRYAARFDVALSVSSFDHDGLGRYGDPLAPDGDLAAMDRTRALLKPNGTLVLTVPVGADAVLYNAYRRYGDVRLPLLLSGWTEAARVGWRHAEADAPPDDRRTYEPVFVLRNTEPVAYGTPDWDFAFPAAPGTNNGGAPHAEL